MHVRSRTNNAHFSKQYIYELGKLVDVRFSKKFPDARDALIIAYRLLGVTSFVDVHRAEFVTIETFTCTTNSFLAEKNRAF